MSIPLVNKAVRTAVPPSPSSLHQAMNDPHPHVKDTTAWTIGRIFEFLHSPDIEPPLITSETLPPIVSVLVKSLQDSSHVAYRVCCAISSLAMGFQGTRG